MGKEVDPADIGKHPNLIKKAQSEMSQSDVLVCGKCHSVFHFVELFKDHKESDCMKDSTLKDCRETKAKVWAFLLWKSAQLQAAEGKEGGVNSWRLYQTWVKLDESVRETWVVAGKTIQSFAKMGQGNLQEMPVKITKTIIENANESPEKKTVATPPMRPGQILIRKNAPPVMMDTSKEDDENQESETDENIKVVTKKPAIMIQPPKPVVKAVAPPAKPKTFAKRTHPQTNIISDEEVEKILAKRFNPRRKEHEYLVKWMHYAHDQNTWEPLIHLQACKAVLDYFEVQLARQKEQRAAAAARTLQQQQADKAKASSAITSPQRPNRSSKTNAIDKVKQWTSSEGIQKRKQEDSEYEPEEGDADDEDSQNSKKFKQEVQQAMNKIGQSGNVKIVPVGAKSPIKLVNGSAKVKVEAGSGAEVVLATKGDGKQSGIVRKVSGVMAKTLGKNDAQIRVIGKGETLSSGVVKIVGSSSTSPTKTTIIRTASTPVAPSPKPSPTATVPARPGQVLRQMARPTAAVSTPTAKPATIATSPKTQTPIAGRPNITTRIVPKGGTPQQPAKPPGAAEQKIMSLQKQGLKVVRKSSQPVAMAISRSSRVVDDDDSGLADPFPEDLPPVPPPSPPKEFTLCPITGKVLGQAEGEPTPVPSPESKDEERAEESESGEINNTEVTQLMTNEDGSPIIVAGADGTLYQVAGKNAAGQTLLIVQGADGEQTICVAAEEGEGEGVMSLDAAVNEAVNEVQQPTDEDSTQLTISTEGKGTQLTIQTADADGTEGQITAEVVQADLPSPGGTRRVVLLLPDGSFMMTEVNDEQYQQLNLVN